MLTYSMALPPQAEVLSGGERARLALAKFMMTKGTLLVLDEPTNHLDIPSKEMLEEACKNFQGALIAASHDRYFLRQVATRVLEVRDISSPPWLSQDPMRIPDVRSVAWSFVHVVHGAASAKLEK